MTTKLVSVAPRRNTKKKHTCHIRSFTNDIFVYSSFMYWTIGFRFSSTYMYNCTGWKDYRKLQIIYLIIWKSSSNHLLDSNQPTDFIWRHSHFDRLSKQAIKRTNVQSNLTKHTKHTFVYVAFAVRSNDRSIVAGIRGRKSSQLFIIVDQCYLQIQIMYYNRSSLW